MWELKQKDTNILHVCREAQFFFCWMLTTIFDLLIFASERLLYFEGWIRIRIVFLSHFLWIKLDFSSFAWLWPRQPVYRKRLRDSFFSLELKIHTGCWTGLFQRQIPDRKTKQGYKTVNRSCNRFSSRTGQPVLSKNLSEVLFSVLKSLFCIPVSSLSLR